MIFKENQISSDARLLEVGSGDHIVQIVDLFEENGLQGLAMNMLASQVEVTNLRKILVDKQGKPITL